MTISALVALHLLANAASSVTIVAVNKVLFNLVPRPFLITSLHFSLLYLLFVIMGALGIHRSPTLTADQAASRRRVSALLALAFCGYVATSNVSLRLNSPGFVQTFKVLNTPVVAVLEGCITRTRLSHRRRAALALVVAGAALCSSLTFDTNVSGLIAAVVAVLGAATYQLGIGAARRRTGASTPELLEGVAPTAAALMAIAGCVAGESTRAEMPGAGPWLAASGLLSIVVNVSMFFTLSEISAVTYNVVSQAKTALNYAVSFIFFHEAASPRNLAGIACALSGAIIWSLG